MTDAKSMREKIKILSELNEALECEELTADISSRPSGELLYKVFKNAVMNEIERIFSAQSEEDVSKINKIPPLLDEILSKIDKIKSGVAAIPEKTVAPVNNTISSQAVSTAPKADNIDDLPNDVEMGPNNLPIKRVASLPRRHPTTY